MSVEQLDRLFASAPQLRWLDLTGGEIVTRADIAQIGASVRARLPKLAMLHFPTAGFHPGATVAAANALRWPGGPRLVVTISVDGPPALHDRIRGVDGAWDRAMQSWNALRAEGVEVWPGMTLQPGNIDAVDATIEALAATRPGFSAADLHLNVAHLSAHYFDNAEMELPGAERVAEQIARFVGRKGPPTNPIAAIERLYLALLKPHLRHRRSPIPCRSGELSAYIAPCGEVHACTIDPRTIGHLRDHDWDLGALWETAARRHLAAEIAADRCVGCWTPCEAYQTLLASPAATARALLRG